ncbi:hypothetical protein IW492_17170 [Enterococcus sp. BWB1-3]|nr:hypothetical protein [Enterococcus sp. BWB1-3]
MLGKYSEEMLELAGIPSSYLDDAARYGDDLAISASKHGDEAASAGKKAGGALGQGDMTAFRKHFVNHKHLLEDITGKKYKKLKSHGDEFLEDLAKLISDGTVKYEGLGTLNKGGAIEKIYRGNGVTLVVSQDGVFRTLLETGKGMDIGIMFIK